MLFVQDSLGSLHFCLLKNMKKEKTKAEKKKKIERMRELCREERKPSLLDVSVQFDLLDSRGGRSRK